MRTLSNQSITEIIDAAVTRAIAGVSARIQRELEAAAVEARRAAAAPRGGRSGRRRRPRVRPQDLTKWVAGRQARRVPKFVIEMTGGLDTKKAIVARYGGGAVFQKGKPLPPVLTVKPVKKEEAARVITAKPPVVRKAAAR